MSPIALAVLGGSSVAAPAFIYALRNWSGNVQNRPELRVVLLGRSLEKLERVRGMRADSTGCPPHNPDRSHY